LLEYWSARLLTEPGRISIAEIVSALEEKVSVSAEMIESLLNDFQVFEAADLVGKKKSLH